MKNKAFTILELITVVILLGVMAAFAIPNYRNSKLQAVEKTMAYNLEMISEAANLYLAKEDAFPVDTNFLQNMSTINANLNIYITSADGETYSCTFPSNTQYQCHAIYANPAFDLAINDLSSALPRVPYCFSGACLECGVSSCPF